MGPAEEGGGGVVVKLIRGATGWVFERHKLEITTGVSGPVVFSTLFFVVVYFGRVIVHTNDCEICFWGERGGSFVVDVETEEGVASNSSRSDTTSSAHII